MSTSSSTIFSGSSRFSTDFQNVITRAVAIANLPITQLTNQSATFVAQTTEFGALGSQFSKLQSSIAALQTAVASGSLSSSSSDSTIASATLGSGAQSGTYTVQVLGLGSYTNTISDAGSTAITDPSTQSVSSSTSFTLNINDVPTTINPATNTLNGLVSAINSNSALKVQATIVNVGSTDSPDYRLSLQSTQLAADTIQLNDGTSDLLSPISTGVPASYQVDGIQTPILSSSRTITLSPGLTVNLKAESGTAAPITISVVANSSSVQNALSQFVNSYNGAATEIGKNQGSAGGALQGQSVVSELSTALQRLGSYSSGFAGLSSLTSLGITYDKTGQLSLDATAFGAATAGQLQALTSFLGDSTTGGFLQFATNSLSQISDATTGLIATSTASVQTQTLNINELIATQKERVNTLTTNLQNQIARSDALVAGLEQTYNLVSGLFAAQLNGNSNSK